MAAETQYNSPAIVAGTPDVRDFRFMVNYPYPWRTRITFDNQGSATFLIKLNGRDPAVRVPPGRPVTKEGQFLWYTVDATVNTAANELIAYESGGLDEVDQVDEPAAVQ